MTSNLGIDWYTTSGNYAYKRNQWATQANRRMAAQANNYNATTSPSTLNQTQTDVFSLSHTSGCTDGADDGKIGLFSAIGNVAKGVGKTVVNAAKGALGFKSDGTWSPLKLAKTVAIGAVCAAFPAAALVACGIGAVAGGAQIVKGVGNAMSATTDAEAKSAWQNVGAGAFTTAASVAGAKASYKGVVKSSTTGKLADFAKEHSVKDASNLGSMIKAAKGNKLEFAKALGEDMLSSTKNNGTQLLGAVNQKLTKLQEGIKKSGTEGAKDSAGAEGAAGAKDAAGNKPLEGSEAPKAEGLKEGTPKGEAEKTGFLNNIGKKAQDLWDKTLGKKKTEAQAPAEQAGLIQKLQNRFVKDGKITFDYKALGSNISKHYQTILGKIAESGYGEAVQAYGYSQVQDALAAFAAVQTIDVDM